MSATHGSFQKRRKSMLKPVAVIRKVEDSPDWLDRTLVAAYLRTSYAIHFSEFTPVRVGVPHPVLDAWMEDNGCRTCAFITAWNPRSQALDPAENDRINPLLEADLAPVSKRVLPGTGLGDDGRWPGEKSFLACGITAGDAVRLGIKYGQNAIVWCEKGELPALWWLDSSP